MKLLVPIKSVIDPDQYANLKVGDLAHPARLESLGRCTNPFDECALEVALRLSEDGRAPRQRLDEVVVISIGNAECEVALRSALALGASRAVRIDARDDDIDASLVSHAVAVLAMQNESDLVLLGKQTADGDGNEVAQRTAALLGWPVVIGATGIEQPESNILIVQTTTGREQLRVRVELPAIVSVDLPIVAADNIRSRHRVAGIEYTPGIRFASLPAIIAARRNPLEVHSLNSIVGHRAAVWHFCSYEREPSRGCCQIVASAGDLVEQLSSHLGHG